MTAQDLLSRDLLSGLDGVESGLRRRRKLGVAGAFATLAVLTLQIALAIRNLSNGVSRDDWYVLVPSVFVAAALVLFFAARYWIRESRAPFRYTCRIVDFEPVPPTPKDVLPWLRHDLAERLNERIGRLSFRDDEPADPEQAEAHVQIAGEYLLRSEGDDRAVLEVTPRVRVGGAGDPEILAHSVRYDLRDVKLPVAELMLKRDDYDKILERVYFSVATRLYRQIQDDVERKIALLPTRYLRATAYLHEAEDYAQSNTLDAYEEAEKLYERALLLYDPSQRPVPQAPLRRLSAFSRRPGRFLFRALRRAASHLVVRLAKREMMLARTELGLANTLAARRALARLSGRRVNQVFAARGSAQSALRRLSDLRHIGYPGTDDAIFNARVTLALVLHYLGADKSAQDELEAARASLPARAEQDPAYLFVAALLEPRATFALSLLRRAVELNPRFEVAHFERARRAEILWQFRRALEPTVAENVIAQYTDVVRINPGNVAAWTSLGHTRWLIADIRKNTEQEVEQALEAAEDDFRRGLEYEQIKRETFMAQLHHNLARVAAERGSFGRAYFHYVAATTATVGEGSGVEDWAQQHDAPVRNEAIIRRFERYVSRVAHRQLENVRSEEKMRLEPRILGSIAAFVRNDYGEACSSYYARSRNVDYRHQAQRQYRKARRRNASYVMPEYNLFLLSRMAGETEAADDQIDRVIGKEPKWAEAILEKMMAEARRSIAPVEERDRLKAKIDAGDADLRRLEQQRLASAKDSLKPDSRAAAAARRTGLGADARELVTADSAPSALAARIEAARDELARWKAQRDAEQKKIDESATRVLESVRALVPHEWLWREHDERRLPLPRKVLRRVRKEHKRGRPPVDFNWRVLKRRRAQRRHWALELSDLHVRALATWALARALSRRDQTESSRLRRGTPRTKDLLHHLEQHFWPERWEILLAQRKLEDMDAEHSVSDRIGDLAARSLAFDPAHYLLLVGVDEGLEADTQAERKRTVFSEALNQRHVPRPVLVWLGGKLEALGAYEDALKAYNSATRVAPPRAVVDAEVRLGKARAEWGRQRFDDALNSLRSVAAGSAPQGWRTAFVAALAERGQLLADLEGDRLPSFAETASKGAGALTRFDPRRVGRRKRAGDGDADSAETTGDEAKEHAAYLRLVFWLTSEHRMSAAGGDTSGCADAASALLRAATARYANGPPHRTVPLPEVSARSGGSDAAASATVTFMRRFAVEINPAVADRAADTLKRLVQQYVPDRQKRILAVWGVPTPSPTIATNAFLPEQEFRVLVNEIPVEQGSLDGAAGHDAIRRATVRVMRQNLETLVGIDEVVQALRALPGDTESVRWILDNDDAKLDVLKRVRAELHARVRVDLAALAGEEHGDVVPAERLRLRASTSGSPRVGPSWRAGP